MHVRLGALAFVAAVLSASAGERVPVQRPAQDDSISAAGRQLDGVKAGAATMPDASGAGAMPRIAVPQLQTSAEPVPATRPNEPVAVPSGRPSANWLVDAMLKPKAAADDRKHAGEPRQGKSERRSAEALGSSASREGEKGPEDERDPARSERSDAREDAPSHPSSPVFNPLARYMAGWMAPQDYALLRGTLDRDAKDGRATNRTAESMFSASDLAGAPSLGIPGLGTDPDSATPGRGFAPAAKPADNPYLEALTAPPPGAFSIPPPAPAPAVPFEPVSPPAPATTQRPGEPVIPGFVKPLSDEKYFKPLKRF